MASTSHEGLLYRQADKKCSLLPKWTSKSFDHSNSLIKTSTSSYFPYKNFTLLIWSQSDHSKGSCNKRVKHFTKRRDWKKATQFGSLVTKLECDDILSTQCRILVKSETAHRQHTFTTAPMVWMDFTSRSYHP